MNHTQELDAYTNYLKPLIGGNIEAMIYDESEGQLFSGLMVNNKGIKYTVWVLCDPEGNGPGHLDIEKASK